MKIEVKEELIRTLNEIDAKIRHLENSPNRVFVLVEYETLNLFHWFNEYFKQFRDDFDHSVSQLLFFHTITKRHSELIDKYDALFREQIDYLESVIDFKSKSVKDLPPVIFLEDKRRDVIGYYMECFKDEKDEKGNPLCYIDTDSDTHYDIINGKRDLIDFYSFRSDELNDKHYTGLISMYHCLISLSPLVYTVCSYPKYLQLGYFPSEEEIICNIKREMRIYAQQIGQNVYRELRKIFLELKRTNNESHPANVWGEVMRLEDEAFRLAISDRLVDSVEERFDHIDEDQRKLWSDNYSLLQKIKDTSIDDELFDINLSVETHNLLSVLNEDNLDLFYELVLRRNIIHREMYPEKLNAKYEEWINPKKEQQLEEGEVFGLISVRQSKLDEIIGVLLHGNWKEPATVDNLELLLNAVFGRDVSLLDESDTSLCEKMWALIEGGRGDRKMIVSANLAGFFADENLLDGTPTDISKDLFGNTNMVNSINDGKKNNRSNAFEEVIPFLKKYTNKIIRQQ